MITIILSAILVSFLYTFLRDVLKETRAIAATFSIFMFILITFISALVLAPKEKEIIDIDTQIVLDLFKTDTAKDNTEIIKALEANINEQKNIMRVTQVAIVNNKYYNWWTFYPPDILNKLVRHSKTKAYDKY